MTGMQHNDASYESLLSQLRRTQDVLAAGPAYVAPLLEKAASMARSHEAEHGRSPAEAVPMALAVRAIARQDTNGTLLGLCLHFWLSMPACCWSFAVRQIATSQLPFSVCEAVLAALPTSDRLLLVHEALRAGLSETAFSKWCRSQIQQHGKYAIDDLLDLMERLYNAKRVLNMPMAEQFAAQDVPARCLAIAASASGNRAEQAAMGLCVLERAPSTPLLEQSVTASPAFIALLLQALRADPPSSPSTGLVRVLAQLALHASQEVRRNSVHTMAALAIPNLPKICLLVLRRFPEERNWFYPALFHLTPDRCAAFFTSLPPRLRQDAAAYLLHLLMTAAPDLTLHTLADAGSLIQALPDAGQAAVRDFMRQHRDTRWLSPPAAFTGQGIPQTGDQFQTQSAHGTGLFSRKKSTPEERTAQALTRTERTIRLDAQHAQLENMEVISREFTDSTFAHSVLSRSAFEDCLFRRTAFSKTTLNETRFVRCTFEDCDLSGCIMTASSLEECVLRQCDISGADIANTGFSELSASQSLFCRAVITACTFNECLFEECSLRETAFSGTQLLATHCQIVDVTDADFFSSTLRGCTFQESSFIHTRFERSRTEHSFSEAGNYYQCVFRQTISDEAHLLAAAEEQRFRELADHAVGLSPAAVPAWCHSAQSLAEHVVLRVLAFRSAIRLRARFLRLNAKRIGLANRTLEKGGKDFFTLLPLLIHTRLFEDRYLPDARDAQWPVCAITGYTPTLAAMRLAREYFGDTLAVPSPDMFPPAQITADALYTMGSVGSIAMTADSDIDYWLSLTPETATPERIAALSEKLTHISRWAEEHFGLETTFFVMNRDSIIKNDFGSAGGESSGTAQALLLKEEFYRTALKVCGRDLAWWVLPETPCLPAQQCSSQSEETTHAAHMAALRRLPFHLGAEFVDFGPVLAIPPDEYFGAALWQMVKALKMPFKSVMKLGLLEAYLTAEKPLLLCETIKQSVTAGKRSLLRTDPYITLMRTLREHYRACGNEDAAALLQTAFLAKLHATHAGQADPLVAALRARAVQELYGQAALQERQDFASAKLLGDKLRSFFLHSYTTLREQLEGKRVNARISPEDMTKLGRTIFAAFAPRKDKVERMPFVNSMGRTIKDVLFRKDPARNVQKGWVAMGLPRGNAARRDAFVEIKTDGDPTRLMAWLVVNGIYHPDMHVEVDVTMAPIAAQDVVSLLRGLHTFFPPAVLATDEEETLHPEMVVRAYCVLNFALPRDTAFFAQVTVVYLTNWGELFCTPMAVEHAQFSAAPRRFLADALPFPLSADAPVVTLAPYKSRIPRLALV